MKSAVHAVRLPNVPVGDKIYLDLPQGSTLLRGGIDPGSGTPALWFTYEPRDPQPLVRRTFFVLEHTLAEPTVCDHSDVDAEHRGMWWAAAQTYHLFELIFLDSGEQA